MNKKRETAQNTILSYIKDITNDVRNVKLYEDMFKSMGDKEFDVFMTDLRDNKITLSIVVPPGEKTTVSVGNNLNIGKKLGYNFFQRLNISKTNDTPSYTTPNEFMVIKLPIKRASQLLSKKISIPSSNTSIDLLSGQVTGASRSSRMTNPEIQILMGLGLNHSIKELMKIRGGDIGAGDAMRNILYKQGRVSQQTLSEYSTGVESTKTLKQYLNAMHIRSTL